MITQGRRPFWTATWRFTRSGGPHLTAALAAATLAGSLVQAAAQTSPAGARSWAPQTPSLMANPYALVDGWPTLPPSIKWGAVINIVPDGQGGVWVLHRAEPPILHIDRAGTVVKSFGEGMFVQSHGLCLDRAGNLWAGDSGPFADDPATKGRGFQVFKFSPEGRLLLRLGTAGISKASETSFIGPTACAVNRAGDVFIADGHVPRGRSSQADGDRIVKYSAEGQFLAAYGKLGSGPSEFDGPHALAFDSQDRLFVADRSNNRVQIFDAQMRFLDDWRHFGRPSGLAILEGDKLFVADSESSRVIDGRNGEEMRNPGWRTGVRIGSARTGALEFFMDATNGPWAEGLGVDASGAIYTGTTRNPILQKWVRR